MIDKKFILIIAVFIALGVGVYLAPSPQKGGEAPKTETAKQPDQKGKADVKAAPERRPVRPRSSRAPVAASERTSSWEPEPMPREPEPVMPGPLVQEPQDLKTPAKTDAVQAPEPATPEAQDEEFQVRVQDFKSKYQWDDPATMNMGEYMIGTIPKPFRDSGLSAMMKNLDEAQQQGGGAVDERMLLESIEKTMPENIRPMFRKRVEQYKAENR